MGPFRHRGKAGDRGRATQERPVEEPVSDGVDPETRTEDPEITANVMPAETLPAWGDQGRERVISTETVRLSNILQEENRLIR